MMTTLCHPGSISITVREAITLPLKSHCIYQLLWLQVSHFFPATGQGKKDKERNSLLLKAFKLSRSALAVFYLLFVECTPGAMGREQSAGAPCPSCVPVLPLQQGCREAPVLKQPKPQDITLSYLANTCTMKKK